jgi:hypothetical protein
LRFSDIAVVVLRAYGVATWRTGCATSRNREDGKIMPTICRFGGRSATTPSPGRLASPLARLAMIAAAAPAVVVAARERSRADVPPKAGELYAAGWNGFGQLGDATNNGSQTATAALAPGWARATRSRMSPWATFTVSC